MTGATTTLRRWVIATAEAGAVTFLSFLSIAVFSSLVAPRLSGVFGVDDRGQLLAAFAGSLTGQGMFVLAIFSVVRLTRGPWLEPGVFGSAHPLGWLVSLGATALFVTLILLGPVGGHPIGETSLFNLLGSLFAGPGTGAAEEIIFRGVLMARLAHRGLGVASQIVLSGLFFGLPHAVFGLMGGGFDLSAALGVVASTTVLGVLYAVAYQLAGRRLWPAIAGHAALNVVVEPWLVLSFLG